MTDQEKAKPVKQCLDHVINKSTIRINRYGIKAKCKKCGHILHLSSDYNPDIKETS